MKITTKKLIDWHKDSYYIRALCGPDSVLEFFMTVKENENSEMKELKFWFTYEDAKNYYDNEFLQELNFLRRLYKVYLDYDCIISEIDYEEINDDVFELSLEQLNNICFLESSNGEEAFLWTEDWEYLTGNKFSFILEDKDYDLYF